VHHFDILTWLGLARPGKELHIIALAACIAILADTVMGELGAAKFAQLRSKRMREMLSGKLISFVGILGGAAVLGLLTSSWYVVDGALIWIIRIEFVSMMETLVKLEGAGVDFGAQLGTIIDFWRGILEIETEHHTVKVSGIIDQPKDGTAGATVFTVSTEETTHVKEIGRKGGEGRPKIMQFTERPVSITTGPPLD
jgi:hypothetical protein